MALLFVRFEQGRGTRGVPKTWVPYMPGSVDDPAAKPEMATLVRMAVQQLRAYCCDGVQGHGRDLMPGRDDEYALHAADGGLIEKAEDIRWEVVGGHNRAEVVLTWRNPAELLMEHVS